MDELVIVIIQAIERELGYRYDVLSRSRIIDLAKAIAELTKE